MDKWRQKIFDELDYLKEKESVLEKRKALMDLLLPENKEKLDKFILTLEEIGLHIGKSRESRERVIKELLDDFVPPP